MSTAWDGAIVSRMFFHIFSVSEVSKPHGPCVAQTELLGQITPTC